MKKLALLLLAALLVLNVSKAYAHCEIPCGIYEDSLRISLIKEHITTIEKSMKKINEISIAEEINYNQLVRWINNKEDHAEKLQEIVSQYFLHQRIKITDPADKDNFEKYTNQLVLLHHLLFYNMKCKQTTDLDFVTKLRKTTIDFEKIYFHKHE